MNSESDIVGKLDRGKMNPAFNFRFFGKQITSIKG